ncbi:MAG: PadR family transcriptional regulator [Deltaproteobacteria bacterium]|nr:PadR family transcriptional regulator [Deltaproteobacteria bacterium]MBW2592081.1 PadR family transcriptional regulator [Deltaproteobacteria bacterium]
MDTKIITREILLGLIKIHILYHAAKAPVVGQWMLRELAGHGYEISPGTMYPLLQRMEKNGWLRCEVAPRGGARARKSYYLTDKGQEVLSLLRGRVEELWHEIGDETDI